MEKFTGGVGWRVYVVVVDTIVTVVMSFWKAFIY